VVELLSDSAVDEGRLLPIAKVTGWGPPPDLIDLSEWAAWRWAGPQAVFLRTASPPRAVPSLPLPSPSRPAGALSTPATIASAIADAFDHDVAVLRLPPAFDARPVLDAAVARGDALVVVPSVARAAAAARHLRERGQPVALVPDDWPRAAAGGCTVVGARAAAWAPVPRLAAVVVIDEHDESLQEERAPTWHARDVARERARRAGVPCVLVSPCPSLEALAAGPLLSLPRIEERQGWPVVEVVDRRNEPPGLGLYSERLVAVLRDGGRVLCVLNRKGRARLLACAACGEVARCDACGAAVGESSGDEGMELACARCETRRPRLCAACGSQRLRVLRVGVSRVREDVERLVGELVEEVTATSGPGAVGPTTRVVVGTEAVLHRVHRADVVVFLDFDQELLAPRVRAGEEALALLARAGRLVGGRDGGGRVVVQTRLPDHEVLAAAVHGDPSVVAVVESARRAALRLPPETALAMVSGPAAPAFVAALPAGAVEVIGPARDRWLLRAPDHVTLGDALAATPRPPGRLRVEVDPLRV
jgi:primosomal protein N' (replication factor Y)